MTKKLNMIYSNRATFFSKVKYINQHISRQNESLANKDSIGSQEDIAEIKRGKSYAIFPELREEGKQVTIDAIRESLSSRGVKDKDLQDKVLFLIIQHRGGVQYMLGKSVSDMLLEEQEILLGVDGDYTLDLEVHGPSDVTLTVKTRLNEKDLWDPEKVTPALDTSVKINITPDLVSITDFEVTKLSDTKAASDAFKFLEDNQQNILEKFVTFIKHALGFNSELRLEDAKNDSTAGMSPR